MEIVGADKMDEAAANDVIMAARAHWFDDEPAAEGEAEAEPEGEAAEGDSTKQEAGHD
jgi:N utilization substance protein A